MGVDVNLYAVGIVSDDELAAAEEYVMARSGIASWGAKGDKALARDDTFDEPRIEFQTPSRYYGAGYERGDWPSIYGAIRVMQAAFPGHRIYYGGDSWDHGEECTEEMLDGIWRHYLGPDGDAYDRRRDTR